jgi:diacylglycerol kinase family enzyme
MSARFLIIANPVSGAGRGERLTVAMASSLEARGCEVEVRLTTPESNGRVLATDVRAGEQDAVVVVGGDGSVNDVINGLPDEPIPVAVLPAGTANVWAREAGLPRDTDRLAEVLQAGRVVRSALWRANGEAFFLFVGAGLDARIVESVERRRKAAGGKGGMRQWVLPAMRVFLGRPHAELSVEVEGRTHTGLSQVLVTRIRRYAGSLRLPEGIDITDDRLHVLGFPQRSRLGYLPVGLRALTGRLRSDKDVIHVTTAEPVRISSEAVEPYHVDGDHAGRTPVDLTLDRRIIELVVPPPRS